MLNYNPDIHLAQGRFYDCCFNYADIQNLDSMFHPPDAAGADA
jgi:hypothetical protein